MKTEYEALKKAVDNYPYEDNKLQALDSIAYGLRSLRKRETKGKFGFYVAVIDLGSDIRMIREYTPIGFVSYNRAQSEMLDLNDSNDYLRGKVIEVSQNDYRDFVSLQTLTYTMYNILSIARNSSIHFDGNREIEKQVTKAIKELREKLGLKHSYEIVREPYIDRLRI